MADVACGLISLPMYAKALANNIETIRKTVTVRGNLTPCYLFPLLYGNFRDSRNANIKYTLARYVRYCK